MEMMTGPCRWLPLHSSLTDILGDGGGARLADVRLDEVAHDVLHGSGSDRVQPGRHRAATVVADVGHGHRAPMAPTQGIRRKDRIG